MEPVDDTDEEEDESCCWADGIMFLPSPYDIAWSIEVPDDEPDGA
jgi:hypothetical protein